MAQEEAAESYRSQKYRRFAHQPAWYYGDHDEDDSQVLASEATAEELAWRVGWQNIERQLFADGKDQSTIAAHIPPFPRGKPKSLKEILLEAEISSAPQQNASTALNGKRKALKQKAKPKKAKGNIEGEIEDVTANDGADAEKEEHDYDEEMRDCSAVSQTTEDAARAEDVLSMLDTREVQMPAVPDRARTEAFILQARKRALRKQCKCDRTAL